MIKMKDVRINMIVRKESGALDKDVDGYIYGHVVSMAILQHPAEVGVVVHWFDGNRCVEKLADIESIKF